MKSLNKIDKDLQRLRKLVLCFHRKKEFAKEIKVLETLANVQYTFNNTYVDTFIESEIAIIAKNFTSLVPNDFEKKDGTIVFYDGFGLDRRGLAAIYVRALIYSFQKVIYITSIKNKDRINYLKSIIHESNDSKVEYIKSDTLLSLFDLIRVFNKYKCSTAFFYSMPDDIVGSIVFSLFSGKVTRYLINLTDHAFWIGRDSVDHIIEFRDYGASVSKKFRKIDTRKLTKLPFYPEIDYSLSFQGFPFDSSGKKIVFSGGSLYKTFSDDNLYYIMLEKLLVISSDIVIWYAGSGDATRISSLIKKYPKRIYFTGERKDLFQILQRCDLYINTYPICGGLMTQYSAAAGIVPLTLVFDECARGFLLDEKRSSNYFTNVSDLLNEAKNLLTNNDYADRRRIDLENQIISKEKFALELSNIIDKKKLTYSINYDESLDTSRLQKQYAINYNILTYSKLFINRKTLFYFTKFPIKFFICIIWYGVIKIKNYIIRNAHVQ